jgi:PAT family beta-lactamase induction signal transducer AmpG
MLICVFTGFASGLPLYLLIQLIPAWFRKEGVSLADIGLFTLVTMPYVWKFAWAPLLDQFFFSSIGRRRSWLFPMQLLLLLGIASLGFFNPHTELESIVVLAGAIAIFSATQDIALDAYRREILSDHELGLGNSVHVQAYRISGLIPGSLSLILADFLAWQWVFMITALFMLLGLALTLSVRETKQVDRIEYSFEAVLVAPFREFIERNGVAAALKILLFMLLYKLGDSMATALSTPFYIDLGFSLSEIGIVAKNAALWPSIVGGLIGGVLMLKIGINRALWLFGVVQLVTIIGFAILAEVGNSLVVLAVVISLEYLGVGLGTAAFTAFIARTTSLRFAATQFALLTALAALPRTVASSVSGFIVEYIGWTEFFILCTVLAIPGMLMLFWVAPFKSGDKT